MFQSFADTASPDQGPPRLAQVRAAMLAEGLAGYLVPRADAHQGEYVAPCDERLAWLTGFTGSAGSCIVLPEIAGLFVDGRYRAQVRVQVDQAHFTPLDWPEVKPAPWLREHLTTGGAVGFDPWLHTPDEIATLETGLAGSAITLRPVTNLIDRIWHDRPAPPCGAITVYPEDLAGASHA